jgi:5-methylcytosine-specific restriction protein B
MQIGHSYLLPSGVPVRDLPRFVEILRDDIVPLLEEYCYEDFEALERILGSAIVLRAKQRIDTDLFEPERHLDLIHAILSAFDGITATRQAVEADAVRPAASDEDEGAEEAASE